MKNNQAGPVTAWEADLHDGIPWQNQVKEAVGFHNPGDRSSRNCRKGERESLYQSLWSQVIARSQYRNAFCGTGLVSLPGLLLPPLPLSVGQVTTHVLSSSTLQNSAVPAQYALPAVPLPTEWHLLN